MNFQLFCILHIILAGLINTSSIFTTLHAILILLLGLYWTLTDDNSYRPTLIIFYITGAELLWRGFGASIFWEYGKYSTGLIMILLLTRYGLNRLNNKYGFWIIILLLPSFIALNQFQRQDIAHALAGRICLGLSIIIFSNQIILRDWDN